ncbi:MAG: LysE/ArgO family amino acid transporter [Coriobacteriia bacterium]|jgi:L-lysine exporter family protein LysE/ArgO|nr:LysE/ArgO family amino acid transporter [Coriobacteriia bacterium]
MVFSSAAYLAGIALGASLVIAIGAQNAFVLQQGLRRQHVLVVATICSLIDAGLIALGAAGFGSLISSSPTLTAFAAWGGAAFLFAYGLRSLRAATRGRTLEETAGGQVERYGDLRRVVAYTLAVSLLNPHVYLDTVVILGTVAAGYPSAERVWFAAGAMTASFVWFFSLAYGARALAPLFSRPRAWQVLDVAIALVMWWIAASLALGQLAS